VPNMGSGAPAKSQVERLVGAIERDGQGKRPACRACQSLGVVE
jgi:hypothetical protein